MAPYDGGPTGGIHPHDHDPVTGSDNGLDIALAHASQGRRVFPFLLGEPEGGRSAKTPLVKWKTEATTDAKIIRRWWARWPDALPGWRLDGQAVVVDVDDPGAFEAAGLDIDLRTASQLTPRGGYHLLYEGDGRPIRQTVKEVEGADTRVADKGWVGLYGVDSFEGRVRPAPEFLYDLVARDDHSDDAGDEMGTRDEILAWLGTLRRARLGREEMYGALQGALASGRIVALDESRPWADKDLLALAREAAKWEMGPEPGAGDSLAESLARWKERVQGDGPRVGGHERVKEPKEQPTGLIIPIAEYRKTVPTDIPWVAEPYLYFGGVTLVAGPPKGGKSTLMAGLQRALERGGEFLGEKVAAAPALLVTEESGVAVVHKTGGMSRLAVLDRRAAVGMSFGQVLDLVDAWCSEREMAVVFIDTFAVWAGIDDENSATAVTKKLDMLNGLAAQTGSAIVLIHHTRKGGGKDGEAIRGSSAIFASVDIGIELTRPKEGSTGRTLDVQGRVILPRTVKLAFDTDALSYRVALGEDPEDFDTSRGATADLIADALRAEYPEWLNKSDLMQRTGKAEGTVRAALTALKGNDLEERQGDMRAPKEYRMAPLAALHGVGALRSRGAK